MARTLHDYAVYIFVLLIFFLRVIIIVWRKLVVSAARQAYVDAELPRWERAMKKWNELYYCVRNDVVFIPDNSLVCKPASEMSQLLYMP